MILKRILYLICSILTGISIVVILIFVNDVKKQDNGFVRVKPSHVLTGLSFKDVKYNTWSIGAIVKDRMYLTNKVSPNYIMMLDTGLKDSLIQKLLWPDSLKIKKGATVAIEEPYIYMQDGGMQVITSGLLEERRFTYCQRSPFFTASLPFSPTSFVFRSLKSGRENILVKQTGLKLDYDTTILQKQVDGIFSSDGTMVRVPETDKFVYVYYYRNQFMVIDTNLNLLFRGKTLDTISKAQIKVIEQKDKHKLILASSSLLVNKNVSANKDYLFIQSGLKADNDIDEVWNVSTVIDVYDIKEGRYRLSLYVPHFKGIKVKEFKVIGNKMFVLYDNYLYRYAIRI